MFLQLCYVLCVCVCVYLGWLHKLWEVVVDGGAVVFHSEEWDAGRIRPYIEKW